MNILLGLTGSVATTVAPKLVERLKELGNVKVVVTKSANAFMRYDFDQWTAFNGVSIYDDSDEWLWDNQDRNHYQKNDPVLHIELRKWATVFVIAPMSANTLAKMANGICDNLLTSVLRAWDFTRPIVLAPAMNTFMWQHPTTEKHLAAIRSWDINHRLNTVSIVHPVKKMLACGDQGEGAMANIDDIVEVVRSKTQWMFPLRNCTGIPVGNHPGAFGVQRKHSRHTGVDLYAPLDARVRAVESGRVIAVEHFTGPQDNSPWWENTDCVLVEGASGTICYGEIDPWVKVGDLVSKDEVIASVLRVLKEGKERPDIPGHMPSMLHMELYPSEHFNDQLLDPTPFLINACFAPGKLEVD